MQQKLIDIIIFSGQSNMQGQAEAMTDVSPVDRAWEYKWCTDSLVPLCNPVGENITYAKIPGRPVEKDTKVRAWLEEHVTGSSCYGNTNLVPKFCESYIAHTDTEVLAVHIAKGSTVIEEWIPGSVGFDILAEKANAAIKRAVQEGYSVNHICFVWLQGESDALAGNTKVYYKEQLKILCNALKEQSGIEKFGIIRVGRFVGDARDDEIIDAQDEICEEYDDFIMLTRIATELNKIPEYMNPFVKGHYSAKGLEKMGAEAGKELGKLL